MHILKRIITTILSRYNYKLTKIFPIDYEKDFLAIEKTIHGKTMTSLERQYALYDAVKYITSNNIQGDIVECGVWRGGSTMIAALTLEKMNDTSRHIYLYDTFAGMSEPTVHDISVNGKSSTEKWKGLQQGNINTWDYASREDVEANVYSTGYPKELLTFVEGKVEDTIPKVIPEKIALLRLDTDWYESTAHELEHLFPRLVKGGVLIIDDYGHWQGARKAVDEYLKSKQITIFLNRIDYTGRIGIKI